TARPHPVQGPFRVTVGIDALDVDVPTGTGVLPGHQQSVLPQPAQAARERGVRSPLQEVGLTKDEIRALARDLDLPNWDKPAAACLSSRIPYGWTITAAAIGKVAKAEGVLKAAGFRIVRVRSFGDCAVIEVGRDEIERFRSSELRRQVRERFRIIGFARVFLDEEGYGSGKLNDRRYVEKALRFPPLGDDREESGW
ncbi:MAG: hypothetical protein ACWGN7_05090, partial [Thermodesulfovibrionales bacterium]